MTKHTKSPQFLSKAEEESGWLAESSIMKKSRK